MSLTAARQEALFLAGKAFARQYPPEQYYYIGVGRSPHPLLAYVQATQGGSFVSIPFSDGRAHFELTERAENDDEVAYAQVRQAAPRIAAHFGAYLPSPAQLGDRRLLLVDYVDTGGALAVAIHAVETAMAERGLSWDRLNAVGITTYTQGHSLPSTSAAAIYQPLIERGYIHTMVSYFSSGDWKEARAITKLAYEMGFERAWVEETAPVRSLSVSTIVSGEFAEFPQNTEGYDHLVSWIKSRTQR